MLQDLDVNKQLLTDDISKCSVVWQYFDEENEDKDGCRLSLKMILKGSKSGACKED